MEPRDLFGLLRRNWILIVALALTGLLGGGAASLLVKPSYESETQLFVAIQNSGSVQELQQGNTFSQARVQSYVKTVSTPSVLQPVVDTLGLAEEPEELAARVKATSDLNTVLITITVRDDSPVRAAAIAEAVGTSLIKTVDQLERSDKTAISPVKLSVITPAKAPLAPASPNARLSLVAGLVVGIIIGLAAAVLRQWLDKRVRSEEDVRTITESPILGAIAFESASKDRPLITQVPTQSPRAEAFRQLRTNMMFANVSNDSGAVLITSSLPGEGKTSTATNLALAWAQSGQSVVLVDADLRRPKVAQYLGLDGTVGLTTALVGAAPLETVLQPWGDDQLYVLTSGMIPPNPSELLGSEAMIQLIRSLEATFDVVIIDSPPLLPVTDASVLAQHVGGVVLVVDTKATKESSVKAALNSLIMVRSNLLGVILNRLPAKGPDAYHYTYESAAPSAPTSSNASKRRGSRGDLGRGATSPVPPVVDTDSLESLEGEVKVYEARRPARFPLS